MSERPALVRGRDAFARQRWKDAYTELSAAAAEAELEPDDLERLATAAYVMGKDAEAISVWRRAHHELIDRGKSERAARCGFWLCLSLLLRGERAQCAGWLARTERMLADADTECVEHGYALLIRGLLSLFGGDASAARALLERAFGIAERHREADLIALTLLSRGQTLIELEEIPEGVALLDEAMVGVTSGEVSPAAAGIVYCAVILDCQKIFDVRRAHEWTMALDGWCRAHPDLASLRGRCLVHRSQVKQLRGEWTGALEEARQACERLSDLPRSVAGLAFYQRGELHRLRGELAQAEDMYREAGRRGCEPQPGAALLWWARGDLAAAERAIRRLVGEAQGSDGASVRPDALGPYVEIMLAVGDVTAARWGVDELTRIAEALGAPFLHATAAQVSGALLLAEEQPQQALTVLRRAATLWEELEMPYDVARVGVLIGCACQKLGDQDTGRLHFDAARSAFESLGAAPDVARIDQLVGVAKHDDGIQLTQRELEVLSSVAQGRTNRQIAAELAISEHTVARHMSNIFNKLGVNSRTAASAYAFEHGLV